MLVTDVGDQMCWWQVWDVGDRFRMFVTDLINWENRQHNEKVANIMILPPTSEISHHNKVTYITMSPTSLSPKRNLWNPHIKSQDLESHDFNVWSNKNTFIYSEVILSKRNSICLWTYFWMFYYPWILNCDIFNFRFLKLSSSLILSMVNFLGQSDNNNY